MSHFDDAALKAKVEAVSRDLRASAADTAAVVGEMEDLHASCAALTSDAKVHINDLRHLPPPEAAPKTIRTRGTDATYAAHALYATRPTAEAHGAHAEHGATPGATLGATHGATHGATLDASGDATVDASVDAEMAEL